MEGMTWPNPQGPECRRRDTPAPPDQLAPIAPGEPARRDRADLVPIVNEQDCGLGSPTGRRTVPLEDPREVAID